MADSKSEERICIPEKARFDKLNLMLIAYLKAGAGEKAVRYRDASIRSGVSHTVVSANNKFFVYAGFLVEEGRGRFRLTENGVKYAQLMDWGRLEEAKEQLGKILFDCSLVGLILDYVSLQNEVTRDDLSRKIGSVAQVPKSRRFTSGINALTDMIVFSGLLQEEDDMLKIGIQEVVPVVGEPEEREITPSQFSLSDYISGRSISTLPEKPREISIPISLTINVTDITDTEKLREILRVIKEELSGEKGTQSQG